MIHLSDEEARDKGKELVQLIDADVRDRSGRAAKIKTIRQLYFGQTNRTLRYPGQVDMHLPVLTEKIEELVPKEMNAFWGSDPHVQAERVSGGGNPDMAKDAETHLNWACDTNIPDLFETMEIWFRNCHLDGTSVVKSWYNHAKRWTTLRQRAKNRWVAGDMDLANQPVPTDRVKVPYEILQDVFGPSVRVTGFSRASGTEPEDYAIVAVAGAEDAALTDYDEGLSGLQFEVEFREERRLFTATVTFHETEYMDEVELEIHRQIITKDNVEVDIVSFEDLIVPYRARNLQEAPRVAHQYWMSYKEFEHKRNSEGWNLDETDMTFIKNSVTTSDQHEQRNDERELKTIVDAQIGQDPTGSDTTTSQLKAYTNQKALVLEVYASDDLDGDGVPEEVIYQIPYGLGKIVHACYLEEEFPHRHRPFAELRDIPQANMFYALSQAEYLAPINIEVNAIINMVHEAQEIINNPWFFYVPAFFTIDPKQIRGLQPGQGIPVADINSVVFPHFPQQPLANLSAVDSLLLFADRLTVSPQVSGSSQVRNAPRTARGTLALLSEAGIKVDQYILAAQKGGWRELMYQIHALYYYFGPEEKYIYVTGNPKPYKIAKHALDGRYEFKFTGNTVNTNREMRRNISFQRYQALITNPLYAMDMRALRNLTLDFLRHNSEGANIDDLLPNPQGMGGTHPPYSQETENQMMMQMVPVGALPTDNHAQHMAAVQMLVRSPIFEQQPTEAVALIGSHFTQHAQLMLAQQQAGRAPIQGGANNQPAPDVMNPGNQEGGVQ
jgi:hypothetical protein